jgi:alkaline phosphatase
MGLNITTAADIYSKVVYGRTLFPNNIAVRGTTSTRSADSEVTDSAAAATALLSGYKTNNHRLNVLPDNRKVLTVPQTAREKGLAVGVVSTTRLTHATPAAMYGHSVSRDNEQLLADQFLGIAPEVAFAGGLQYFVPSTVSKKSKRTDQRDIIAEARQVGYTFVSTVDQLRSTNMASVQKILGLFSDSHMSYEIDRLNEASSRNQPSLAEMTKAALDVLKRNPRGFFLMIEGGRIDHACHGHDIKAAIYDVIAFNNAVEVALEFQKAHPDVLIIVTADHETGGLALGRGTEYGLDLLALKPIRTSIELLNKKYAKAGSKSLDELLKASGFALTEQEKGLVMKQPLDTKPQASDELRSHGAIDRYVGSWLGYALSKIESDRAKIGWTSFVHTAAPIITYAVGPGEKYFAGTHDNTDIAKNIFRILGLEQREPSL